MLGIITEYNPFHNGHLLHINKSKEKTNLTKCVVVMSGNFVQRGEPAIFDKFLRAKMALLNGADIVLELPIQFATSSAEFFALGAIDLLEKTGVVNKICFGSEKDDIEEIFEIAKLISNETEEFKKELRLQLSKGISFPKARQNTIEKILNKDINFLSLPNNILALEYLKAIVKLNSKIKPFNIKREQASFHSEEIFGEIASATALRLALKENRIEDLKKCIPKNCFELIENYLPYKSPALNDYSNILNYILKFESFEKLQDIFEITEGLENRILKNLDFVLISDLIEKIKCKRYTYTKLQRVILNIILKKTKQENLKQMNTLNSYIRILGFKKDASDIVSKICKNAKVPVITNLKSYKNNLDTEAIKMLEKNIKATDIYYIGKEKPINYEFFQPIVII